MKTKTGRILREPHGVSESYPRELSVFHSCGRGPRGPGHGNAVVLKPSEFTSLVARGLESFLVRRAVRRRSFRRWWETRPRARALSEFGIDKLVSRERGDRQADRSRGGASVPVVLELGGKDPMVCWTMQIWRWRRARRSGARSSTPADVSLGGAVLRASLAL